MTISGTPIISHTKRPIPQCERYLVKTKKYSLPILSGIGLPNGPLAVAEICEKRFSDIIDNQMKGAIDSHGEGIYELGEFSTNDDAREVRLSEFRGFLNSIFIENLAGEDIVWEEVDVAKDQYLFIGLVEEGDGGRDDYRSSRQFGEFVTRVGDVPMPGQKEVILAKRTSGIGAAVDVNVPNKKSFKTVEEHVFDDSPHGGLWIQTEAVVNDIVVREELDIVDQGTVTISGIFENIERPPGRIVINESVDVVNELISDKILMESNVIFDNLSEFKDELIVTELLIVESGVNVYNKTRVHDHWEFNDQRSVSGVGIRNVNGEPFGTLSGNGEDFVVFDPSDYGTNLDDHLAGINPHRLTASGISSFTIIPNVIPIFGGGVLEGNLGVEPETTIDGIDFSTLVPLIDGSNADSLHKHLLLQNFEYQFLSPEFPNSIISGVQPGWLESTYDGEENRTQYSWFALQELAKTKIIVRPHVPIGYGEISNISIYNRVSSGASVSNVNVKIFDTDGIKFGEAHQIKNLSLDRTIVSGIGGNFVENNPYRIEIDLLSEMGVGVHISDIIVKWRT